VAGSPSACSAPWAGLVAAGSESAGGWAPVPGSSELGGESALPPGDSCPRDCACTLSSSMGASPSSPPGVDESSDGRSDGTSDTVSGSLPPGVCAGRTDGEQAEFAEPVGVLVGTAPG